MSLCGILRNWGKERNKTLLCEDFGLGEQGEINLVGLDRGYVNRRT